MKRILSTLFIVFISGLLILLFIVGDMASSCGGGAAAHGLLARIDGHPVYYQTIAEEINAMQVNARNAGEEFDQEELIDRALERYIVREVLLAAAKKSGLALSVETRREILFNYLGQAGISPAQFAGASKGYRRDVERQLNESHLGESLQSDIVSSPKITNLALKIEGEVKAFRSTIDMVYVDIRSVAESRLPTNEELEAFFNQASAKRGSESWRRAKSFQELSQDARADLVAAWKKENFPIFYVNAIQEAEEKMKTVEEGLAEGKDLARAALEAGLPLYTPAPFSWGETLQAGGMNFPVNGDFYRQTCSIAPGGHSGVIRIPADLPQVVALFRVRARQVLPTANMDLFTNRAEFEKLSSARQDELRQNLRAQIGQLLQRSRYALMEEFLNALYQNAHVIKIPRNPDI